MRNSKLKTLFIYKILDEYSDENNPLTTVDIIEKLAEKGIMCERKSIYSDIKVLNDMGCDILSVKSPKRGFFIASRKFELPEVRLLIDAVIFAGFITPNKTKALVAKLESLVSHYQAKNLTSQVYCEINNKCDNEEIYYTIDRLDEAIAVKKQVKFIYRRRNIDKENKKSYTNKSFTVSPYALIWKEDHYYLVCNNSKYDNLINLRLDRIRKIELTNNDIRPVSEVSEYKNGFDAADYSSKMFNMFSGEASDVTLICSLSLREQMMDRLGNNIALKAVDSEHFETTFSAAVSDGLVSWIMQYGTDVKVKEPQHLAELIKDKAKKILDTY